MAQVHLKILARLNPQQWLWLAFLAAWGALLPGCATEPPRPVVAPANIPAEVRAEFQESVAGWNTGNLDRFIAIYADTATFAVPDGFLQGRRAIREFYAPNFKPGATRIELVMEDLEVEVLSPDVALVRGIYQNRQFGEIVRRGPTTLVLKRWLNHWRIIHDHSS